MSDLIFLGNTTLEDFARCGWKTKKLGSNAALDVNQKPVSGIYPFFVERSEIEAKLEEYKKKNYRDGIEALTQLLNPAYSPYGGQ